MANIVFSKKASEDLENIWQYTLNNWSISQAEKYTNQLMDACQLIVLNPTVGKKYTQINNSLLGYKINKHILFYFVEANKKISLIRILHEKMDLRSQLQ